MTNQKRKDRRRSLGYPAHIMSVDHVLFAKCRVEDVSNSGMKITVDYAEDAPNEFILLLSGPRGGGVTRLCRVVRREPGVLGVIAEKKIVADTAQKVKKGYRILQKKYISDNPDSENRDNTIDSPLHSDDIDALPPIDYTLSLAEYRLLRRIGQFGAHYGKLPLKFKYDNHGVVALVSRGLVEKGPSGWPGVPAYRITAAGGHALRDWTPNHRMAEHAEADVS